MNVKLPADPAFNFTLALVSKRLSSSESVSKNLTPFRYAEYIRISH